MANNEKKAKLQELRATIEYLNVCINNAEKPENNGAEVVAMSEILLMKAYELYPDIVRVFE